MTWRCQEMERIVISIAGKPYFVMAKEKLADIYLNYKKDRRLYAVCYRELVEQQPSPQTCILLGDAYMAVQVVWKYGRTMCGLILILSVFGNMELNTFNADYRHCEPACTSQCGYPAV